MIASAAEQVSIEPMTRDHWDAVRDIYLEGIRTGNATFEQSAPDWEQWDESHLSSCRLVARAADELIGWAALSPYSRRRVYAGVAEVSVYISENARGRGIGFRLLSALIESSGQNGIWTLQAGIFPENISSIALHTRCGFRVVGVRERIGCMHGRWRDVVLMERRSAAIGLQEIASDDR